MSRKRGSLVMELVVCNGASSNESQQKLTGGQEQCRTLTLARSAANGWTHSPQRNVKCFSAASAALSTSATVAGSTARRARPPEIEGGGRSFIPAASRTFCYRYRGVSIATFRQPASLYTPIPRTAGLVNPVACLGSCPPCAYPANHRTARSTSAPVSGAAGRCRKASQ